jgi:hypothetical protein
MKGRGRNRSCQIEGDRGSGWYRGEMSWGRSRAKLDMSPTPSHATSPQDERRALRELWQAKGRNTNKKADAMEKNLHSSDATQFWGAPEQERLSTIVVIVIEPQVQQESPEYFSCQHSTISDAIKITTQSFNSFAKGMQK